MNTMRQSFFSTAIASALLLGASTLHAQNAARPVELGVDMGIAFTLDDPKVTTVQIPTSSFRAGFYVDDRVSIEPTLSLQHASVSGGGSGTEFYIGAGALYHFSADRSQNQMYVRPYIGLNSISGGGSSATQASIGVGLGAKVPVQSRLAARFEGTLGHGFETDRRPGVTGLGFSAGLSFFTR
jgi:hypothetical protein